MSAAEPSGPILDIQLRFDCQACGEKTVISASRFEDVARIYNALKECGCETRQSPSA